LHVGKKRRSGGVWRWKSSNRVRSNDVCDLPARSRIKPLIAGILGIEQVREGPAHPQLLQMIDAGWS